MHYLPVTAIDSPHLPFIKKLYHDAFPQEERRDWKQLLSMIGTAGEMRVQVITDQDKLIGLIVFWVFDDWFFIEHLAVSPDQRGMKYGERIMSHFMDKMKVLLEVEPPSSADAIRRVRFYERLGLSLLPLVYRQPSYREAGVFYEMELMSNGAENEMGQFEEVLSAVLQKVYGFTTNK
jgi:ribosomal protein S18 acetylase RimI-like enzyme